MKKLLCIIACLCTAGCGHTVYTSSKGLGVDIAWNTDTLVPSFRGGQYNVQSYVPRGNSTMTMTTSTGGILGTGGTSQSVTVSTGTQFNQGNISKVLQDPNTDPATKLAIAQALPIIIRNPVPASQSASRTTYAASATGLNARRIQPDSTGVDKIVDKVADNADVVKDVANNVVDKTGEVTKDSFIAAVLATKWTLIVFVLGIICVFLIILSLFKTILPIINNYFTHRKITATTLGGKLTIETPLNTFLSSQKPVITITPENNKSDQNKSTEE